MTRRRWIADEVSSERAALVGGQAAHLARVLRARVGQEFDIAAQGRVRRGRVTSVSPQRVEFDLGEEVPARQTPDVILVLAVFKFDRMEWAIEKCTELGVGTIIPLVAQRSEPHLSAAAGKRVERWRRIARAAAQQSRRTSPPDIQAPGRLKEVLTIPAATRVVLAETEAERQLRQVLEGAATPLALAVGPEGGWTEAELGSFSQAGWRLATLGSTILRAETAAIAALAVAMQTLV